MTWKTAYSAGLSARVNPPYDPVCGHAGAFTVHATHYPVGALRPNKLSAGMSFTASRSNHSTSPEANTLAVRGTLSRSGFSIYTARAKCPCCGSPTERKKLSASGKTRLQLLRAKYNARAERRNRKHDEE